MKNRVLLTLLAAATASLLITLTIGLAGFVVLRLLEVPPEQLQRWMPLVSGFGGGIAAVSVWYAVRKRQASKGKNGA